MHYERSSPWCSVRHRRMDLVHPARKASKGTTPAALRHRRRHPRAARGVVFGGQSAPLCPFSPVRSIQHRTPDRG
ncbi:MAG: hypothetical protein ACK53Y_10380 [bacterium]